MDNNNTNKPAKHNSQSVAEGLQAEIDAGTINSNTLLTAMVIAHCYRVNSNVAGHALRRLVKSGAIVKAYRSCAGSLVYKLPVKTTRVSAPTFCVMVGKWEGIETSYSKFVQALN